MTAIVQTALRLIYPPQCLVCQDLVNTDFGLCGTCWRDTPFIGGLVCDSCGIPLPGDNADEIAHCDRCISNRPLWDRGRAAVHYRENGRKLVLGLKTMTAATLPWLARVGSLIRCGPLLLPGMLVVPTPLHWMRMMTRRYNQSARLAEALADQLGLPYCPDLLKRIRRTCTLDRRSPEERRRILDGAIRLNERRTLRIEGRRPVLLIDDVMTTGATLNACAKVLRDAGAGSVCVATLARAGRPV